MIKNKITVLYLLVLIFILSSCNNNLDFGLSNSKPSPVEVKDKMLCFKTTNDYCATIDQLSSMSEDNFADWELQYDYLSLRKSCENQGLDCVSLYQDKLFATLLNSEKQIKINGEVFEMDFDTQQVKIVRNNRNSTLESSYDFDDDVLDVVFSGVNQFAQDCETCLLEQQQDISRKRKKKYCRNGKYKEKEWFVNMSEFSAKVNYVKLGIYYALTSKIKKVGNYDNKVELGMKVTCSWVNKKSSGSDDFDVYGTQHSYKRKSYSNARRLKDFTLSTYFEVDPGIYDSKILTIRCSK